MENITLYGRLFISERFGLYGMKSRYNYDEKDIGKVKRGIIKIDPGIEFHKVFENNFSSWHRVLKGEINTGYIINNIKDFIHENYFYSAFRTYHNINDVYNRILKCNNFDDFINTDLNLHFDKEEKEGLSKYIASLLNLWTYYTDDKSYFNSQQDFMSDGTLYFSLEDALLDNEDNYNMCNTFSSTGYIDKEYIKVKSAYSQSIYDKFISYYFGEKYSRRSMVIFKFDVPINKLLEYDFKYKYKGISIMEPIRATTPNKNHRKYGFYKIVRSIKIDNPKEMVLDDCNIGKLFEFKNFDVVDLQKNSLYKKLCNLSLETELQNEYGCNTVRTNFSDYINDISQLKQYTNDVYSYLNYKDFKNDFNLMQSNLSGHKKFFSDKVKLLANDDITIDYIRLKLVKNNFDLLKIVKEGGNTIGKR